MSAHLERLASPPEGGSGCGLSAARWPCGFEVEVLDPLILKTGHRPVTALGLPVHMHPLPLAPLFARSALPRKRVRSVARMRPTGRADQCPQLGVERTQRGRRLWAVHDPI